MVIEINKDIERYQESVMMGLTFKQLIYSAVSVAVGGTLVFFLYRYIGLTASVYVAVPVVAPIALGGFYSYNGMSFYEVMQKRLYFMFVNRTLTYISTESEQEIEKYLSGILATKKKQNKKIKQNEEGSDNKVEFEKAKKKMKRLFADYIIGIIVLIAGVAFYKYIK